MRKIIINVCLLNLLAAPCLLTFNDVNPITGEWNWVLNLIGIMYSIFFYHHILKPMFKPMM